MCLVNRCKNGIDALIFVEGQAISFNVDTGLSITILAEALYHQFFTNSCPLKSTLEPLFDYFVKNKSSSMLRHLLCSKTEVLAFFMLKQ